MSSKKGLNLYQNYSINFSIPKRTKKLIKFVIIHYTGMKKESKALERLCDIRSEVSSHYFIKKNGKTYNLVPDLYTAWHAGKSTWKKYKSLNKYSIGIEISNPGHENGYKNFTKKQIISLSRLLKFLIKKYSINLKNILGHSDISPHRKKDPGEKFPWKELANKRLAFWHPLNLKDIQNFRKKKIDHSDEKKFFRNLNILGYEKTNFTKYKKRKENLIKSFQRRYRQELINGKLDQECYFISKSLLKS